MRQTENKTGTRTFLLAGAHSILRFGPDVG